MTSLPVTGLGVWKIDKDKTANIVYSYLLEGGRHIDSACDYGNELQGKIMYSCFRSFVFEQTNQDLMTYVIVSLALFIS